MGVCTVADVERIMQNFAPEPWAETYDNCGLLIGWRHDEVRGIYVALDPCEDVVEDAIRQNCNMIVTHHPMFFGGAPKRFTAQGGNPDADVLLLCAREGISLYAAHTNLDRAWQGVNDCLCDVLGLENKGPLKDSHTCGDENMPCGLARLAAPKTRMRVTLESLALDTARALGIEGVEIVGDRSRDISSIALCGGAGGSLIEDAAAAGADVLITGEAKHHERLLAKYLGICLIVAGHAETEQIVLPCIASTLQKKLYAVQCKVPVVCHADNLVTGRIYR